MSDISLRLEACLEHGRGPECDLISLSSTTRRVAESMIALANTRGGLLVLTGPRSTSVEDPDGAMSKALEAILAIEPRLVIALPEVVALPQGTYVCVEIPTGLGQVYSVGGKHLVRQGSRNVAPDNIALRKLLVDRGQSSFEAGVAPGAAAGDIDWERVQEYMRRVGLDPTQGPESFMQNRGCLVASGVPSYAGILLFGREPERYVRSAEIVAVRYAGDRPGSRYVREDIRGALPDQIRRAHAFALDNMRKRATLEGLERVETTEYPEEAIREAIVNAAAHRDYAQGGDSIRLLMFSDRMEVHSPGRLPGHVTVDNLVEERYSRNEIIVQVLADLGFVERLGYGIDRMVALLEGRGLPPPEFAETANGFCVTLRSQPDTLLREPDQAQAWRRAGYNPRQQLALAHIDREGQINNRTYRGLCPEVSAETLRRDLADLVRRGVLIKVGEKRGTIYIKR